MTGAILMYGDSWTRFASNENNGFLRNFSCFQNICTSQPKGGTNSTASANITKTRNPKGAGHARW